MLRERQEKRKGFQPHTIVEYHPAGRVDRIKRLLANKWKYGLRTQVVFETDPHEHPVHGKVYGTDVRNGSTLHR